MTGNLHQFLFKKKTLATVCVMIVLMVVGGFKIHSYLEWKRERIEIAERVMSEFYVGEVSPHGPIRSVRLVEAKVTQNGGDRFTVEASLILIYSDNYSNKRVRFKHMIDKKDGEWGLSGITIASESIWNRIKEYVSSFLP